MSQSNNNETKQPTGVIFGLLSALLFGLSTPLAKMLVGEVQPVLLAGLLYLGSGLGLSAWWLFKRLRQNERLASLTRKELPYLAGAIICGGILGPLFLLFGLTTTMASSAALLLNLEGVLTAVIAWVVFKENCDKRIVAGMIAITLGGIVLSVSGQNGFTLSWGCVLIALACLSWAIDNNLTRNISHGDAMQIALIKGLSAGVVNLGLAFVLKSTMPAAPAIFSAMIVGFLGYGVSLVLFVLALRHLGTARTGAYFSCAPFAGAIASIVLLHDQVSWSLGLAALLMGVGVYLHLSEHHEHEHVHDEMEHEHEHVHDEHHRHDHGPDDPPGEPHTHAHKHERLVHTHPHFPDLHHRHDH